MGEGGEGPPLFIDSKDTLLTSLTLPTPTEFSFAHCLDYLARSSDELLYQVDQGRLYQALRWQNTDHLLLEIMATADGLQISLLNRTLTPEIRVQVSQYVIAWFDLDRDLAPFYQLGASDTVLQQMLDRYYGLRLIGIADLFEGLCWAIIGQQINLTFAYTLKRRFIETFGQAITHQNRQFWHFPAPAKIATLTADSLRPLQFSTRKAEYIIGVAQAINSGALSQAQLRNLGNFEAMQHKLVSLRGIGLWTAHYVLMRCLRQPEAFPIADVGLHNAIKLAYQLERKPTLDEIRRLFAPWHGWEAYATFYLWHHLAAV